MKKNKKIKKIHDHHCEHDCEKEIKKNLKNDIQDTILRIFDHADSIQDYREYHLAIYFAFQDLLSQFKNDFLKNEVALKREK